MAITSRTLARAEASADKLRKDYGVDVLPVQLDQAEVSQVAGRDGVDLKGAILFLASPASDYVTGHNLVVDGGFSIWH